MTVLVLSGFVLDEREHGARKEEAEVLRETTGATLTLRSVERICVGYEVDGGDESGSCGGAGGFRVCTCSAG